MDLASTGVKTKVSIKKSDTKGTCISNDIKIVVLDGYVEVFVGDDKPIIYKQLSDMTIYIDNHTKTVVQKYNGILTYNIKDMQPKRIKFKKYMQFLIKWFK